MDLVIRDETPADVPAIHALNAAAFETDAEARLVDALRAHGRLTPSLVASGSCQRAASGSDGSGARLTRCSGSSSSRPMRSRGAPA